MKGSYAIAEYSVGGRSYTVKNMTPADDFHRGYRFQIEYDSTDPAISNILFEYPFFGKSDILDSTTGTVVFHDRFKLGFEYFVNDRRYRKFQGLKSGEVIADAQRFQVYFLANDPSNSILKLPYITKISW
jgi:hypothetical protein